ncbi:hypothetical protein GCM10022255_112340 [Dactylosporangium darangshiense]|uniref:Uncharacterized protein n=1 Tax=Dactylosporangium darangshiense TaxID=579108 RepID=A0ABP8DV92_9ACTN
MVQVKVLLPEAPTESVAFTVTVKVPRVVGVPEIRPEVEMDIPVGRPVAVH